MLKIGVNDNVVISKAEKNDKGTLVISIAELGTEVKEKKGSILDDMADGSDSSGSDSGTNFLIFMPNLTKYEKDEAGNAVVEEGAVILKSFVDMKNQLAHFLSRFLTAKQVKFAPFAGIAGVNLSDEKDVIAKIATEAVAKKVYENYVDNFIKQITPFLNKQDKPSRLFLHRKSEASHFGVLRKKFLDNQPFLEGMDIPVELSKLYTKQTTATTKFHEAVEIEGVKYVPAFSTYELKNKLDNTEKVEGKGDAASAAAEQEIENVENLFKAGGGAEDAPGVFQIEE